MSGCRKPAARAPSPIVSCVTSLSQNESCDSFGSEPDLAARRPSARTRSGVTVHRRSRRRSSRGPTNRFCIDAAVAGRCLRTSRPSPACRTRISQPVMLTLCALTTARQRLAGQRCERSNSTLARRTSPFFCISMRCCLPPPSPGRAARSAANASNDQRAAHTDQRRVAAAMQTEPELCRRRRLAQLRQIVRARHEADADVAALRSSALQQLAVQPLELAAAADRDVAAARSVVVPPPPCDASKLRRCTIWPAPSSISTRSRCAPPPPSCQPNAALSLRIGRARRLRRRSCRRRPRPRRATRRRQCHRRR